MRILTTLPPAGLLTAALLALSTAVASVDIVVVDGRASLQVDGEPYVVRGAGTTYHDEAGIGSLAQAGGNTIRTWDTRHLGAQLDLAARHGLRVLAGLDFQKPLQGFDYTDAIAVERQQSDLLRAVERHAGHPALFGWIVANEPNLMFEADGTAVPAEPAVYDALAALVSAVQARDPDHPVSFSLAFTPFIEQDIATALARVPQVDFLSLQAYGALSAIPALLDTVDTSVPFMVTEYGPIGHWEMPATHWGREIEEPSGPKADGLQARMRDTVMADHPGLIGDFVFLWGHKQERTPTWYGLFTADGGRTAGADVMHHRWRGKWPANRAPRGEALSLEGQAPTESVSLAGGTPVTAAFAVSDVEGDRLQVRWELRQEVQQRSAGGHFEATPATLPMTSPARQQGRAATDDREGLPWRLDFRVPTTAGDYRLYAYARDEANGFAYANFPFRVLTAGTAGTSRPTTDASQ